MMKIDAVITWVDGRDVKHCEKRRKWATPDELRAPDKAGDVRFANVGEIFWCVASLNRFASWLNRIYIVTDAQNPHLDDFLAANFQEGHIPIEIVDHTVIFRDYEECLPIFNSVSIETMTWRIPGLSDFFIEFNDDFILSAPESPQDFFTDDGKIICYAERALLPVTRLTRKFKPRETVTTKHLQANGASLAGNRWSYFRYSHCPRALRRDFYERYFTTNPQHLRRNIMYRFRNVGQFSPEELQCVSLLKDGKCIIRPYNDILWFFQPNGSRRYFERKFNLLQRFEGKFICLNSIETAETSQQELIMRWLEKRLSVTLGVGGEQKKY